LFAPDPPYLTVHIIQVSVNGVTGPRENVNPQVESLIQEVKKVSNFQEDEKMDNHKTSFGSCVHSMICPNNNNFQALNMCSKLFAGY
jgi:hypothetical protein